jgi:hypothetical protein
MTFDQWFEQEFLPQFAYSNDDPHNYESAARQAWEAALESAKAQANSLTYSSTLTIDTGSEPGSWEEALKYSQIIKVVKDEDDV